MRVFGRLILIGLLSMGIMSCEKEDCNYGEVRFTNTSSNPYDLYIDGNFITTVSGNSFIERQILEGQHNGRVEQQSGFILFPTIVETTLSVYGCQQSEWVFP